MKGFCPPCQNGQHLLNSKGTRQEVLRRQPDLLQIDQMHQIYQWVCSLCQPSHGGAPTLFSCAWAASSFQKPLMFIHYAAGQHFCTPQMWWLLPYQHHMMQNGPNLYHWAIPVEEKEEEHPDKQNQDMRWANFFGQCMRQTIAFSNRSQIQVSILTQFQHNMSIFNKTGHLHLIKFHPPLIHLYP